MNRESSISAYIRRKGLVWLLFLGCAIVSSYFLLNFVARREAWKPLKLYFDIARPENCEWVFVIGRGREKEFEKQKEVPFRNSLLALYERDGKRLHKVSLDYLCRSKSTGIDPPRSTDIPSYIKNADLQTTGAILYGYSSVPEGFFNVRKENGGYLISDWGRKDGKVALPEPMILKSRYVKAAKQGNRIVMAMKPEQDKTVTVVKEKNGCYIHGTLTTYWSHRDALGCVTLFDRDDPTTSGTIHERGWNTLTKKLQDLGIYQSKNLGLFIAGFNRIVPGSGIDVSESELPKTLYLIKNGEFDYKISLAETGDRS